MLTLLMAVDRQLKWARFPMEPGLELCPYLA